jgi:hypothetical protein
LITDFVKNDIVTAGITHKVVVQEEEILLYITLETKQEFGHDCYR